MYGRHQVRALLPSPTTRSNRGLGSSPRVRLSNTMNPTADEINQRRGYPTPLDSAADAYMRAAFDKRIAGMPGYEAALSATQSLRIEGGLLKFEGVSGGDVITPARAP